MSCEFRVASEIDRLETPSTRNSLLATKKMPQPPTPAGHGEHDEDPLRADLNADDFDFNEAEEIAEDELLLEGEEDADDWFAEGDELGAGDDGFDEDGSDYFDAEGAEDEEADPTFDDEAAAALRERVAATIREYHLFDLTTDTVLVAVSGGRDSVVLLDILHRLGVRVAVAHAHFGLRAEEADADAEFVRKLAKKLEVPFHLEHFATQQFAEKEKISIQMAARALRYAWFEHLCDEHGYAAVATGHHRADAAETMLLNLVRGTGLAGLHGIRPRVGRVVRPLLACSTDDLHDYLVERQLTWREDASNQDTTHYRRNKLRHQVLPVLRELNPNFDQTLALTAERIQQAEALVAEQVQRVAEAGLRRESAATYLSVAALQHTSATALLLGELLRPYGFDYAGARTVAGALTSSAGTRFESPTHRLVIDRGQLVITPKDLRAYGSFVITEATTELKLPGGRVVRVRRLPAEGYRISRNANVAAFDAGKLHYPLVLRNWQPGDWLVPLGMRGKQKVSDLLINQKVPANLKDRVLVMAVANGSLAWVVGHRVDDRFKITPETVEVVEIAVQ